MQVATPVSDWFPVHTTALQAPLAAINVPPISVSAALWRLHLMLCTGAVAGRLACVSCLVCISAVASDACGGAHGVVQTSCWYCMTGRALFWRTLDGFLYCGWGWLVRYPLYIALGFGELQVRPYLSTLCDSNW